VKTRPPNNCPLFASRHQADLLAELFSEPGEWRDFDGLRRTCGVSASTLHSELVRLRAAGMIERDDSVRPYRFRPDMRSPLAEPTRQLVERTVGVEVMLRRALAAVDGIEAAAIFGSWARGEAGPESDIDLFIVGRPDPVDLSNALDPIERATGREVGLVTRTSKQVQVLHGSPLLESIAAFPVIELVGRFRESVST
jgi:predicted nucleotidyltransferase